MALKQLTRLGLSGNKGKLYMAALELGEASVTAIAERAGIGRTTAYAILDGLIEEGLVAQIEKSGRMYVVAEDPQVLLRKLDERRRLVEEVLPELQAAYGQSLFKPRIRYYGGTEGIATVLNYALSCRSGELRGILSMQELMQAPGSDLMERHIRQRIEAGIRLRVVRSQHEEVDKTWLSIPEELREVRYAPAGMVFTMTCYVYDDKVAYISSRREDFALLIQSTEFAGLQTALFETLWAASTPVVA